MMTYDLRINLEKNARKNLQVMVMPCQISVKSFKRNVLLVVVAAALLFGVHGKHLRSCRDGQVT